MLHCVTRRLACYPSYELLSPTAPSKEAVKCLTSYFFFKNVMTSSKFQKFVQTRNSNIRDQRYRYHCCVPGSCLGGSDISQVSPHMRWIKSWGINFEKPKSTPHSTRGAWNGARFHWIESEWHTWGQWNLMQAENPICALKGLEWPPTYGVNEIHFPLFKTKQNQGLSYQDTIWTHFMNKCCQIQLNDRLSRIQFCFNSGDCQHTYLPYLARSGLQTLCGIACFHNISLKEIAFSHRAEHENHA